MTDATKRYLIGWTAAAVAALAVLLLAVDAGPFDIAAAAVLLALLALCEVIVIRINVGQAGVAFTLGEAGIVGGLLVTAPVHTVVAAVAATVLVHLPRRLTAEKIWFNAAQVTVATVAAGLTMLWFPTVGPSIAGRPLAGALAAMIAYAAVNTLAFRGLVRRIAGDDGRVDFDEQLPLTLASMAGTVAVGIVAAQLSVSQPVLIPLLLAPLVAIQLAARSSLKAEQLVVSLRAERDRLERVVVGASDGILLLDRDATIQIWSPALEHLSGIPPVEAVGRPVADVLTDELRLGAAGVRGRWLLDHKGPERYRLDARWRAPGGQERDVQEDHALLFDGRGRINGDVVVVRDVSRERELERLRGDFVARVSHELRTPLTPIRGYLQLLMHRSDRLTERQRADALERILNRTDRLAELIEDLLLVTQLERNDLDGIVVLSPTDLGDVVEETTRAIARRFGRPIQVETGGSLPPALADRARVRQILTALVENAVRYSPAEEPITVSLDTQGGELRLRVADRGPGIPTDDRDQIFEQFRRLDDPLTMQTSGVGLGLFIVRRLTAVMHGDVDVEDNPGGGSVFVVTLPAAPAAAPGAAPGLPVNPR